MTVIGEIALWVLAILAIPLTLAVGVFGLQILAMAWTRGVALAVRTVPAARRRITVLVPAHNESAGIARVIELVLPQLEARDAVLVVADNCTDDTAALARQAGATVVERFHETERGKGFALAFGIDALRADPPGLVVILDADCELAPGALETLADCVVSTNRPAQALYLMVAPAGAGLPRRLAQFAWRVRNWVRPAGWHRLGLPCQLMGTGMAFTWAMLRDAPLANASIVEDMKLGIDLGKGGQAPVFCPNALVTSIFPDSAAATKTQRTRWEHGHLEMILREVPSMLATAARRGDARLAGMALDLCVPPLALLAATLLGGTFLAAGACVWTATLSILVLYAVLLATFTLASLTAWWQRGRDLVRLAELLSIPVYIAAKVPLYLRFIVRRQKHWVRTDRDKP
jgi:cellulose synthase/poly-beta-1,6-N-acetylglucosamine synthase-like glycosyltransferase